MSWPTKGPYHSSSRIVRFRGFEYAIMAPFRMQILVLSSVNSLFPMPHVQRSLPRPFWDTSHHVAAGRAKCQRNSPTINIFDSTSLCSRTLTFLEITRDWETCAISYLATIHACAVASHPNFRYPPVAIGIAHCNHVPRRCELWSF